jgi:omega-6 fatty acid desaturase (delta-12 desaturase)
MVTTLVPLALVMWAIQAVLPISLTLALALGVLCAGLLVRTFIIMHDCAHGSFFASRKLNDAVGYVTGVLTLTPFGQWRRDHALHHASSGDLDRRGHGDMPTLTVSEYLARTPGGRFRYRLVRQPIFLLLGGPFHLAINQRFRPRSRATKGPQIASVWWTNVGIATLLLIAFPLLGWKSVLVAWLLPYYLAGMAGVWLFYVQHQFEDAYWVDHKDWNYLDAALLGSTHLQLPSVLQWFTGSIGLHHVHHIAPRIPNFELQSCHDANPLFHRSPVITLKTGMESLRLALWDEARGRMVSFREARLSGAIPAESR